MRAHEPEASKQRMCRLGKRMNAWVGEVGLSLRKGVLELLYMHMLQSLLPCHYLTLEDTFSCTTKPSIQIPFWSSRWSPSCTTGTAWKPRGLQGGEAHYSASKRGAAESSRIKDAASPRSCYHKFCMIKNSIQNVRPSVVCPAFRLEDMSKKFASHWPHLS